MFIKYMKEIIFLITKNNFEKSFKAILKKYIKLEMIGAILNDKEYIVCWEIITIIGCIHILKFYLIE